MTTGLISRPQRPGKAVLGGLEREHVSSHMWVGPNVLFASSRAAHELRELSLELLRKAGTVAIGAVEGPPAPGGW